MKEYIILVTTLLFFGCLAYFALYLRFKSSLSLVDTLLESLRNERVKKRKYKQALIRISQLNKLKRSPYRSLEPGTSTINYQRIFKMNELEEIKEEITKGYGFKNWKDCQLQGGGYPEYMLDDIAIIYAQQAVTADREHVAEQACREWDEIEEKWIVDKSSIRAAPRLPLP